MSDFKERARGSTGNSSVTDLAKMGNKIPSFAACFSPGLRSPRPYVIIWEATARTGRQPPAPGGEHLHGADSWLGVLL